MTLARDVPILTSGDGVAMLVEPKPREVRDAVISATLSRVCGRSDIVVMRRPSGRPRLLPPYPELGVSMSHRDDLTLVGFSPTRAVGVDVEIDVPAQTLDVARLARDHYAAAEAGRIAALPEAPARALFLSLWVGKEAMLKTIGRGTYDGLEQPDLARFAEAMLSTGPAQPVVCPLADGGIVVLRHDPDGARTVYSALAVAADAGR